jgi:hypothetical protein
MAGTSKAHAVMSGPVPSPSFSQQASAALDRLAAGIASDALWNAICDALYLIRDKPGSADARREAVRTDSGRNLWKLQVRVPGEIDDWVILWEPGKDGAIIIAYIGVL